MSSLLQLLYCFQCGKLYDEQDRLPCLGLQQEFLCLKCLESFASWPIIKTAVNKEALEVLRALRNKLTTEQKSEISEVVKNINEGRCSECSLTSKKLRICLDCCQASGLLKTDTKLTFPERETHEDPIHELKSTSICSDCAIDQKHKEHRIANIGSIENIEDLLELKYLLALGASFYSETEPTDWRCIVVEKYRNAVSKMSQWNSYCETFDPIASLEHLEEEHLKSALEKSSRRVEKAWEHVQKLKMRQFALHKEHLSQWIEYIVDEDAEDVQGKERILQELIGLQEKLEKGLEALKSVDIGDIDKETEKKMMESEEDARKDCLFKLEANSKYFKYKALAKEIREAYDQKYMEKINEEAEGAREKLTNLQMKQEQLLARIEENSQEEGLAAENRTEYLAKYKRIVQMEMVCEAAKCDVVSMKMMELLKRKVFVELMYLKFFPSIPDSDYEDSVFEDLLTHIRNDVFEC
ncbi:unnamed protein product [Caenorhabditis sp. 36 PRJEB53466]|nr:unnamed protein product [Caenorhabditis sp. 36 PRJEB53466]